MQTQTDPSFDKPKCIDCKHFAATTQHSHREIDRCHHPMNGVDLVHGEPMAPRCERLRSKPGDPEEVCGSEGHWFESGKPLEQQFQDWRGAKGFVIAPHGDLDDGSGLHSSTLTPGALHLTNDMRGAA